MHGFTCTASLLKKAILKGKRGSISAPRAQGLVMLLAAMRFRRSLMASWNLTPPFMAAVVRAATSLPT